MSKDGKRVAIIGSTSLLGKSLRDHLPGSGLDTSDVRLLDEEDLVGIITDYDDGATIISRLTEEALAHADLAFLCGSPELSEKCIEMCSDTGTQLIVLGGSRESGSVVTSDLPRARELSSPVCLPLSISNCLATVIDACTRAGEVHSVCATALLPTSEIGAKGNAQLHAQAVELFNFGGIPDDEFKGQLIFNIHPSFGKPETDGSTQYEGRIRREVGQLLSDCPDVIVNAARVPVFFCVGVSLGIRFKEQPGLDNLRNALKEHDKIEMCEPQKNGVSVKTPIDSSGVGHFQVCRILATGKTRRLTFSG